jgi:hypothetical protein
MLTGQMAETLPSVRQNDELSRHAEDILMLEVNPSRELEVAAAGIAGGRAYGAEAGAVDVGADASKRNFIGYILAIHGENKFYALGRDVEGSPDAGVQIVDARIAQAEIRGSRRIAKHEFSRIAEGRGAAGAWSGNAIVASISLIRVADIAVGVGNSSARRSCSQRLRRNTVPQLPFWRMVFPPNLGLISGMHCPAVGSYVLLHDVAVIASGVPDRYVKTPDSAHPPARVLTKRLSEPNPPLPKGSWYTP